MIILNTQQNTQLNELIITNQELLNENNLSINAISLNDFFILPNELINIEPYATIITQLGTLTVRDLTEQEQQQLNTNNNILNL